MFVLADDRGMVYDFFPYTGAINPVVRAGDLLHIYYSREKLQVRMQFFSWQNVLQQRKIINYILITGFFL